MVVPLNTPTLEVHLQFRRVYRFKNVTSLYTKEVVYTCSLLLKLYRRHNQSTLYLVQFNSNEVLSILYYARVINQMIANSREHAITRPGACDTGWMLYLHQLAHATINGTGDSF